MANDRSLTAKDIQVIPAIGSAHDVDAALRAGGGGAGGASIRAVDLGVIDYADVFSSDPRTLYAMQPGEFLSTVRFTDTDIIDTAPGNTLRMAIGIGTQKSFAWYTFAWSRGFVDNGDTFDTLSFAANQYAYSPAGVIHPGFGGLSNSAMVLSAAAVGDIVVGVLDSSLSGSAAGVRFKALAPWVALTNYDTEINPTPGTPPLVLAAIVANGTIWVNTGTAGISGAIAPDFAGNAGGTVADGLNIMWTDTTDAAFTAGTVHAVAEIWTPGA